METKDADLFLDARILFSLSLFHAVAMLTGQKGTKTAIGSNQKQQELNSKELNEKYIYKTS